MGSVRLDCPLCCGESFDSAESLKYHILSVVENIACPSCGTSCAGAIALVEHLDACCHQQNKASKEQEALEPAEELTEVEELPADADSLLVQALTKSNKGNAKEKASNEEDSQDLDNDSEGVNVEVLEDTEEVYSCSGCGISFSSLVDHIKEFHEGEDVVVELHDHENAELGSDTELITLDSGSEVLSDLPEGAIIIANKDIKGDDSAAEEASAEEASAGAASTSQGNQPSLSSLRRRQPQQKCHVLNTLKQEDCLDKNGRLYTRRVVQIEKFWDDDQEKTRVRRHAISQQYINTKDGKFIKVKADDVEDLEPGSRLITINQCSSCGIQFSRSDQFDVHICDHEVGSEFRCSRCDSVFATTKALCAHMKVHKGTAKEDEEAQPVKMPGPFICLTCDTVFPSNKSLRLHRRMHMPVKVIKAEAPVDYGITGSAPVTRAAMEKSASAEADAEPQERETFECSVCNKTFDKSYEQVHMEFHTQSSQFDCLICNRKFHTESNLLMHMTVHTNDKGYMCTYCKKNFQSADTLTKHIKEHCKSRQYQCNHCDRKFARPHEKVKHERIHTGEKPHSCEICGKSFRVSYCLTLHMRTHSGFRPYVCPHCGKRFKAHSVYNHHLLTHSEVRAYKCNFCPKAFKTGVQLAGHRNSHTKPFSCTECNRPFSSLYAVRSHMETHKKENSLKYRCFTCGASYAREFALRDHIKECHGIEAEKTEVESLDATASIIPDDPTTTIVLEDIEMSNSN